MEETKLCKAWTKRGKPCQNYALYDSDYCSIHQNFKGQIPRTISPPRKRGFLPASLQLTPGYLLTLPPEILRLLALNELSYREIDELCKSDPEVNLRLCSNLRFVTDLWKRDLSEVRIPEDLGF